eukprot:jgi/Ulvmu1/12775/UM097_0002.1
MACHSHATKSMCALEVFLATVAYCMRYEGWVGFVIAATNLTNSTNLVNSKRRNVERPWFGSPRGVNNDEVSTSKRSNGLKGVVNALRPTMLRRSKLSSAKLGAQQSRGRGQRSTGRVNRNKGAQAAARACAQRVSKLLFPASHGSSDCAQAAATKYGPAYMACSLVSGRFAVGSPISRSVSASARNGAMRMSRPDI